MKNKFNYIEIVKILNALYREQAELAYQMIHNNNINLKSDYDTLMSDIHFYENIKNNLSIE